LTQQSSVAHGEKRATLRTMKRWGEEKKGRATFGKSKKGDRKSREGGERKKDPAFRGIRISVARGGGTGKKKLKRKMLQKGRNRKNEKKKSQGEEKKMKNNSGASLS